MSFSSKLEEWYAANGRTLPWRGIDDPYRIWLSEIILQQTRIEQGMSYYQHFIERYPTVYDLASASEEAVLKSWQGLGYYSRARNLHAAARQIVEQYGGTFPNQYEAIRNLKGVGRYTAAAIASFAFRLPYPVIDGNVYRVASRYFNIATPIGTDKAYTAFEEILVKVMDRQRPDIFNQALMDFGSTYCKPTSPGCTECIFADSCQAFRHGKVELLPVKNSPVKIRERYFYYIDILWNQGGTPMRMMHQRQDNDIWKGLYELPLIETTAPLDETQQKQRVEEYLRPYSTEPPEHIELRMSATHKLTHQTLHATFLVAKMRDIRLPKGSILQPFSQKETKLLPVSRLIDKYLSQM